MQQEKRTDDSKETEEGEEEGVRVSIELYSLKREKTDREEEKEIFLLMDS